MGPVSACGAGALIAHAAAVLLPIGERLGWLSSDGIRVRLCLPFPLTNSIPQLLHPRTLRERTSSHLLLSHSQAFVLLSSERSSSSD